MGNQYFFSIGSPFAEFVSWVVFGISFVLVFSPFVYLGYIKWKQKLSISWWLVGGAYVSSLLIYLIWCWGALWIADTLLQKYYTNSWWLTTALVDGMGWMMFGVLLGWPLLASYIIMGIKPGKHIIVNLLLSILVTGLMLWGAWHAFILIIEYGFGSIANSL